MASKIFNKFKEPKSTEFSKKDLVVDIKGGHLFYKSNIGVHKLTGDNINTTLTEGGSGFFTDEGTFILHDGNISTTGNITASGDISASGDIIGNKLKVINSFGVEIEAPSGGPRIHFGSTTDTDSFMTMGAFSSINNIDTKARDLHLFSTSTSTGFYFDQSAGKFGIGTTTPGKKLEVKGGISASGQVIGLTGSFDKALIGATSPGDRKIKVQADDADGHYYLAQFNNNLATASNDGNGLRINLAAATVVDTGISQVRKFILFTKSGGGGSNFMGGVYGLGQNTNGVNYAGTSYKRLKHSIVDTHYSIKDLLKIKARDYKWNNSDVLCNGFIAQELNEIYPDAVCTTDNGIDPLKKDQIPWSLDYGKLTPLLVKSIQDQQKMIEELQKEIKEIKNELSGI